VENLGFVPQFINQAKLWDILGVLLDIFIVYLIVYRLLLLIRGTRSVQILTGVGILGLGFILSDRFNLYVVNYLLRQFFDNLFLILVIIFQDEVRRALATVGRNPFSTFSVQSRSAIALDEACRAAQILASQRTGAIIVFERHHGLSNYTEGSTLLDAIPSAELLISIFQPDSPIHDGAAIVRDGKIVAAGCFFPLTMESELDKAMGTRHRAAASITQETDAVAVVVSEERGEISFVELGEFKRDLTVVTLKKKLYTAFGIKLIVEGKELNHKEGKSDS
jgi:diadenylate cyclase